MISGLVNHFEGTDVAVAASGLEKHYGRRTALSHLDLTVPEGAVYLLVGPNGAGKTTFLRTLLDLARADRGQARVFGLSTVDDGPTVRAQIGYVPDRPDLSPADFRVHRLFQHHAAYYPSWDPDYANRLVKALEIDPRRRCSSLSKGQARRVQLVLALAHRPALVLLDEPTDGLDPLIRDRVLGLVADHLATTPTTVLISTHLVREMEGLASHLGIVRDGRLIAQLERDELSRRLLSVRGEVRDPWPQVLPFPVLDHAHSGREHRWVLWTDGEPVDTRLEAAGITVRSSESATLHAASRTLLGMELPS